MRDHLPQHGREETSNGRFQMANLPSHASVVVIGGGIMGCSTLYHLAKMGVTDAVLLERNKLTSGTTWHSAAQVRALRHSQNLTRMIQYSVDLYARLERETGQNVGWIQKGSLSIATTYMAGLPIQNRTRAPMSPGSTHLPPSRAVSSSIRR